MGHGVISLELDQLTSDPSSPENGEIWYNATAGELRAQTPAGVLDLGAGGSGITVASHRSLRHLAHLMGDGPAGGIVAGPVVEEVLPLGSPFPDSSTWYESAAKLKKIVSLEITRNPNRTPDVETWRAYDDDGSTVLATITDAFSYVGVIPTGRTRVYS